MPNLNPRQAGGIEPVEPIPFAIASATAATMADLEASSDEDDEDEEDEEDVPTASTSAAPTKLAKGLGRIERDESGKVIRIVLGGEHGEEIAEDVVERVRVAGEDSDSEEEDDSEDEDEAMEEKPWGEAMAEWSGEGSDDEVMDEEVVEGPRSVGQGIPIGAKRRKVHAKTDIVRGAWYSFFADGL
jgi:nucleolar protein 16